MDEDALIGDVRAWLDRNGYRLEMTTARTLMRLNPVGILQGVQYTDRSSGLLRETDVLATWAVDDAERSTHLLRLHVECKNTTSPWIAFVGEEDDVGLASEVGAIDDCELCADLVESAGDWIRQTPQFVAYALVEKRTPDKSGKDHAREAALSIASAAGALIAELPHIHEREARQGMHRTDVVVAMVNTSSPIIACRLDKKGDVDLRVVDSIRIDVVADVGAGLISVIVSNADAFPRLATDLVHRFKGLRPEGVLCLARGVPYPKL